MVTSYNITSSYWALFDSLFDFSYDLSSTSDPLFPDGLAGAENEEQEEASDGLPDPDRSRQRLWPLHRPRFWRRLEGEQQQVRMRLGALGFYCFALYSVILIRFRNVTLVKGNFVTSFQLFSCTCTYVTVVTVKGFFVLLQSYNSQLSFETVTLDLIICC